MKQNKELIKYIESEQDKFYRLAYSYTHNREDALDVVQNAIVKALSADEMRTPEYYRTWMYKIIVNSAIDLLRKRKIIVSYEDYFIERTSGDPFGRIPGSLDLKRAIYSLPIDLRTIIILRYFEEMKLREISEVMDLNLNTVKTKLYRALDILKLDIEEDRA